MGYVGLSQLILVSTPRQAMRDLGVQICCLLCDAPDIAGTERCKLCIINHSRMRETIGALDAASRAAQLSSEMMQMNSNPQKWDHDEIHGEALQYYQQLANQKEPNKRKETIEDMVETFRRGATKENLSLIQDFANRSPWKEVPPSAEVVKNMEGVLPTPNIDNIGARTIPSKPIKEVNRDDRKGEDQDVVDRIDASVIASSSSLSNKDEVEKEIIRGKMMKRKEWDDVVDNIEDLLDD